MFSQRKVTILSVLIFLSVKIWAQYVDYGTDPYNYKWNIVNTPHFKVIYRQGSDSTAYRYASLLETAFPHVQKTIGSSKYRKFPVVLHPGNMLSNGMVSWAPRRMELITTPSSDLYAQQWDRQLVIHESRHVFQTSKVIRGIFKPLYYLMGEQSAGLSAFLLPTWFLEGDAVATETALSKSGRGRLPEFNMVYRAHMIAGTNFSFDKWFMGSYKDYTGSKYSFGYNLTAYARYKYGADYWDKVTSRYVDRIFNIPPFSNAMKHHGGAAPKQMYKDVFNFLKEDWSAQEEVFRQSGFKPTILSPPISRYASYQYPQQLDESTVIAVKSNYKELTSLVKITDESEDRLCFLGNINSRISLVDNRIYWSEYVSGIRWTHQNYSVVKYFDLETGKTHILTPRKRYLSPSVNEAGDKVVVSTVDLAGLNQVVILDAYNGEELTHFSVPDNAFAKEVVYADQSYVIATVVGENGISIWQLNTQNEEWLELLPSTHANIAGTIWASGKLYFESGLDGTNNIYCLDPDDLQPYKLTTAQFGAFTPALSKDKNILFFSDFQTNGYNLASVPFQELEKQPAHFQEPYKYRLAEAISVQEPFNIDTAPIKDIEFNPKRYHRLSHLFKIHSWAPFYYNVADLINMNTDDFTTIVKPGATILSQNTLNTTIGQAGWYYKDGYHQGKLSFTYMGWYPVIDLDVDYGSKAFDMTWEKNEETQTESIRGRYTGRNLVEAEARIYVPFNFTKNHYIQGFQPSFTYYLTNNKYQQYKSRDYSNFQYLLSELRFYKYRRMAKQDILPRLGYQLRLQHMFSPFNSDNYGHLYAARLTTYLPGIIQNHSLMVRFTYQYQDIDDKVLYLPKRIITEPRGYHYLYQTRQQMAVSADYAFTIANPDFSLGSVMYIRRIRSNAFFDYYRNQPLKNSSWTTQSSCGMDVILDCNVLQIEFPISLGARITVPLNYGNVKAEALFSLSF